MRGLHARTCEQMRETLDLLGELPPEALSDEAEADLRAAFRGWAGPAR